METHIFLIDPLEKLNIKKDSSLLMMHTFKKMGKNVKVLFERNFSILNGTKMFVQVFDFESILDEKTFYLKSFEITTSTKIDLLKENLAIHMRLDPPFDTNYLKVLWKLRFLEEKGIVIKNSARGILNNHEKLTAFLTKGSLSTLITSSKEDFIDFCLSSNMKEIILKPMELFQGIGVKKINIDNKNREDLGEIFNSYQKDYLGNIIVQPYLKDVESGEIRSIFYKGIEIGSILKVPNKGNFLANIAQGASFSGIKLSDDLNQECQKIAKKLLNESVDFIAFDIIGKSINEVNITCPGLLVEVSSAKKENLALKMSF